MVKGNPAAIAASFKNSISRFNSIEFANMYMGTNSVIEHSTESPNNYETVVYPSGFGSYYSGLYNPIDEPTTLKFNVEKADFAMLFMSWMYNIPTDVTGKTDAYMLFRRAKVDGSASSNVFRFHETSVDSALRERSAIVLFPNLNNEFVEVQRQSGLRLSNVNATLIYANYPIAN